MPGETDLATLLRDMSPRVNAGWYVYVAAPGEPVDAHPVVVVREGGDDVGPAARGGDALGLPYDFVAAGITLEVHSALEAVGLTAAFARALTEAGISANVVAGLPPRPRLRASGARRTRSRRCAACPADRSAARRGRTGTARRTARREAARWDARGGGATVMACERASP